MFVFDSKVENKIHLIGCPSKIESTQSKTFETFYKHWVDLPASMHVLDFHLTQAVDDAFIRAFGAFKAQLKVKRTPVVSIRVPFKLLVFLKSRGVEELFSPVKSVESACEKFNIDYPKQPKIDVNLVNTFYGAASKYFAAKKQIAVAPEKVKLRVEEKLVEEGISCVLNISADSFKGFIRLTFSVAELLGIFNSLENTNALQLTEEVGVFLSDLVEEIFNTACLGLVESNFKGILKSQLNILEFGPDQSEIRDRNEVSLLATFTINQFQFFMEVGTVKAF